MSFIFARKHSNKIKVYADTKITINQNDEDIIIKSIGMNIYRKIKSLGVIKNVIINENICISSAGSLEDFNELLEYVDENKKTSFDEICKKALEINNNSKNRTDFIICVAKGNKRIVQIKNYEQSETNSAWIGSKECFTKFQSIRFSDELTKQTIYDCESNKEIPLDNEDVDSLSFSEVLKLKIDDTVGEKLIDCVSEGDKFYYLDKLSTSISKPKRIEAGQMLNLYDNVFDGGYTYYVYKSSKNYKLYIEQLKCGVEYCPYVNNKKYNHLRIPKFDYCSVDEFEEKHSCGNCSIVMSVQNK